MLLSEPHYIACTYSCFVATPMICRDRGGLLLLLAACATISFQCASGQPLSKINVLGTNDVQTKELPSNPEDPLLFGLANNVYQTQNYVFGAYHYISCSGNEFINPKNTAETAQAVAHYYQIAKDGSPVSIRATRTKFHSSATFPCPAGSGTWQQGPNQPVYIGLLQEQMSTALSYDSAASTMRVGGGMTYTSLSSLASGLGMSWQLGSVPVYSGLTLAGVLATTGHGSGYQTTSGIWDTLKEIVWVDGFGEVHVSKPGDLEFDAMAGGLGVYGVITELVLQMTPASLTTLDTIDGDDANLYPDVQGIVKDTPHTLVFWRPDAGRYRAFTYSQAQPGAPVTKGAIASIVPPLDGRPSVVNTLAALQTSLHDDFLTQKGLCPQLVGVAMNGFAAVAPGSNGYEGVLKVTAPTNQLTASECGKSCWFNDQQVTDTTAQDVEFTIELDQLSEWIRDVKKIFLRDLFEDGTKPYRCLGIGSIWMRFGKGLAGGVTATVTDMKSPVFVQWSWLRSRRGPDTPIRYQFVLDLIEELTLCKYNGRPHWGKNFDRTFTHPNCSIAAKYPKFQQLQGLAQQYDPAGMFKGSLVEKVFSRTSYELTPGCSTWTKCYCQKDIHCPPAHKCVPSIAFPQYKVCKADMSNRPGSLLLQPGVFEELLNLAKPPLRLVNSGSHSTPWELPMNLDGRASGSVGNP